MNPPHPKRLRTGFTTGAAAAAAAKGALESILGRNAPEAVTITFLDRERTRRRIAIDALETVSDGEARCTVIKDAGDDPDITHGARIGALVRLQTTSNGTEIDIQGGRGVGRVTKPGLAVPPGQAAINPGPRRMIREAVCSVLEKYGRNGHVWVELFVPAGEALAQKTLNARLGNLGGISILGTTGIERPMSNAAYIATIEKSISVALACGVKEVVMTTGRRSERFAQYQWPHLPAEAFIQIGDFFEASLKEAAKQSVSQVTLAVFFGKAVKMAQGIAHTHARSARLTLEKLARWALEVTGSADLADCVARANTARHAFDLIKDDYPMLIAKVGREVVRSAAKFATGKVAVGAVIFGFDGSVRFDSAIGERWSV
jgi:cobalt-precorrin-5B (C1)-methyltransferase